jgi:hypothetical protein
MRSDLNGYAADSQVNQDYQTLVREQETALGTLRGQQNGERTGTYGTIFEDAKAFASALAEQLKSRLGEKLPLSSQVTLSLREYGSMMGLSVPSTVKTNLENPTQGEARAKNHIKGGGDVFKAFEGRGRGQWNRRENDDSTHVDGTFDHDWQPTEPSQAGSQVLTQPVVMGGYDASQPARGANQGIQSGSPSAAVNAVDKDTGIITGAVGVNQGKAARPHAGYFVNDRTLIWVARENESSGGILYSCFFEHRRPSAASAGQGAQPGAAGGSGGATAQAVPAGSYVIMGLQFIWNRSTQRLSVQRLMGGLYTTPPSQKKLGGSAGKP